MDFGPAVYRGSWPGLGGVRGGLRRADGGVGSGIRGVVDAARGFVGSWIRGGVRGFVGGFVSSWVPEFVGGFVDWFLRFRVRVGELDFSSFFS